MGLFVLVIKWSGFIIIPHNLVGAWGTEVKYTQSFSVKFFITALQDTEIPKSIATNSLKPNLFTLQIMLTFASNKITIIKMFIKL